MSEKEPKFDVPGYVPPTGRIVVDVSWCNEMRQEAAALRDQLAAAEAREAALREALERLAAKGCEYLKRYEQNADLPPGLDCLGYVEHWRRTGGHPCSRHSQEKILRLEMACEPCRARAALAHGPASPGAGPGARRSRARSC